MISPGVKLLMMGKIFKGDPWFAGGSFFWIGQNRKAPFTAAICFFPDIQLPFLFQYTTPFRIYG